MPKHEFRDRRDARSRSRSPYRRKDARHKRPRSRSPVREDGGQHRQKRHKSRSPASPAVNLPYKAKSLSRRQYKPYEPLFASYLDIQKQLNLDDLDEREVKGRWKSFTRRWNSGELARSWYDPTMLKSAQETARSLRERSPRKDFRAPSKEPRRGQDSDSDDDDVGPAPPLPSDARHVGHGPTVPGFQDIALRDELRQEEREQQQRDYVDDIRFERKQDRKLQKDRMEELVPRADPGSRQRQLEKRSEITGAVKGFRDAKEGGEAEVGDADLMGDDGMEGIKKKRIEQERQKNEREIRREEIMRARAAEREERFAERRAKEAETMDYFKAIVKERFG